MNVTGDTHLDYYAVLQVDPGADLEVIEAAYRQLMKKHHPDLAGDDHLARAKALNEAYSVLHSPEQRRRHDENRRAHGWRRPPPASNTNGPGSASWSANPRSSSPPNGASHWSPPPPSSPDAAPPPQEPAHSVPESVIVPTAESGMPGPLALFSAAYYFLPGPYEWEEGSRRELLTVALMPVAGLATFALVTGRLAPWIGHSLNATLLAWGLIVLMFLPMVTALPRIAMAGGPSLMLLSGAAAPVLQQVHVPVWFAWGIASLISVVLAARLFVFGVLPTVAACWFIAQIT